MSARRLSLAFLLLALVATAAPRGAFAQASAERLSAAKELFFDKKYDEARKAWQAVLDGSKGTDADAAAYYVARCSENLGELPRAFEEYGRYLARPPQDRALADRLDAALERHRAEIDAILADYRVPRLDRTPQAAEAAP